MTSHPKSEFVTTLALAIAYLTSVMMPQLLPAEAGPASLDLFCRLLGRPLPDSHCDVAAELNWAQPTGV